jgi:hypothetical protein
LVAPVALITEEQPKGVAELGDTFDQRTPDEFEKGTGD